MRTGRELKDLRKRLGLSLSEMAELLGLANADSVRFLESGKKEMTGPVAKLMEIYEEKIEREQGERK